MLLDGPHLLEEALECGVAVSIAAFADSALENRLGPLADRAARAGVRTLAADDALFKATESCTDAIRRRRDRITSEGGSRSHAQTLAAAPRAARRSAGPRQCRCGDSRGGSVRLLRSHRQFRFGRSFWMEGASRCDGQLVEAAGRFPRIERRRSSCPAVCRHSHFRCRPESGIRAVGNRSAATVGHPPRRRRLGDPRVTPEPDLRAADHPDAAAGRVTECRGRGGARPLRSVQTEGRCRCSMTPTLRR